MLVELCYNIKIAVDKVYINCLGWRVVSSLFGHSGSVPASSVL